MTERRLRCEICGSALDTKHTIAQLVHRSSSFRSNVVRYSLKSMHGEIEPDGSSPTTLTPALPTEFAELDPMNAVLSRKLVGSNPSSPTKAFFCVDRQILESIPEIRFGFRLFSVRW